MSKILPELETSLAKRKQTFPKGWGWVKLQHLQDMETDVHSGGGISYLVSTVSVTVIIQVVARFAYNKQWWNQCLWTYALTYCSFYFHRIDFQMWGWLGLQVGAFKHLINIERSCYKKHCSHSHFHQQCVCFPISLTQSVLEVHHFKKCSVLLLLFYF